MAQLAQALVQYMVPFQEWQHWRLALFDPAAGFCPPRGGPEIFDGALQGGDRAGAPACGHGNLRQVQMKLRRFALELQGGLAEMRGLIPLCFRSRYGKA